MLAVRPYRREEDYARVGEFLVRMAGIDAPHRNWLQARWEYMHYHPWLEVESLDRCGVWEDRGAIVAVVHYEDRPGIAHVELDPHYAELKPDLLRHAEKSLARVFKIGLAIHVYLDEEDAEFEAVAASLGFERMNASESEPTSKFEVPRTFPQIRVPEGLRLQSLSEEEDLGKVHRLMHRGFDHEGEPPEEDLPSRRRKLSAPGFRKDLTRVAVAPGGEFVSLCGVWYDPVNRVAMVEPVATDPHYRRRGLGTAVVLDGIRRAAALGATVAYVRSDQPFYLSMGFDVCRRHNLWRKVLEPAPQDR